MDNKEIIICEIMKKVETMNMRLLFETKVNCLRNQENYPLTTDELTIIDKLIFDMVLKNIKEKREDIFSTGEYKNMITCYEESLFDSQYQNWEDVRFIRFIRFPGNNPTALDWKIRNIELQNYYNLRDKAKAN